MIASVDVYLLFTIAGWIGIGLAIGRLSYALLSRQHLSQRRADLPFALILGLVGATIGGAVGWSMHGALNAIPTSMIAAIIGALLLCVVFQFIVPM